MAHPLDGARLKVVWAQKHLDLFKVELGRYLDSNPHDAVPQIKGDIATIQATLRVHPPLELSCIIGDCVCNLRAALDYISWELANHFAVRNGITPPTTKTNLYFPLAKMKELVRIDLRSWSGSVSPQERLLTSRTRSRTRLGMSRSTI
jgi:hypothetical protein